MFRRSRNELVAFDNTPAHDFNPHDSESDRRDSLGARMSTNNRFAALEATEDLAERIEQDDDQQDAEGDNQNEETDPFDDETSRMSLQQPSAGANVRTMQPTFPPAAEFRPPT